MKRNTLVKLLFGLFITLNISCNKINKDKFMWTETGCADPWSTNPYNLEKDKTTAIQDYLLDQDVKVDKIKEKYDATYSEQCMACLCTTGNTFVITVDEKYNAKMLELNFIKL